MLAEEWIDPWLDEEKLLPGQDWDMEIEKAVEIADAIVICISKTSVTKEGYVQKELKVAINLALYKPEGTNFIFPVRLNECSLPRNLRAIQSIDYFPVRERDGSWVRLRASLEQRAKSIGVDLSLYNEHKPKPSSRDKRKIPLENIKENLLLGKTTLYYVSSGNSVGLVLDDKTNIYKKDLKIKSIRVPYGYWVSKKVVTIPNFKMFMRSTKYKQDISGLYKYSKDKFYISLNDSLAYINWLNIKYKEKLPDGYIFSLPSNAEIIRAIVNVNLEYVDDEFVREDVVDPDKVTLKIRGILDVGDFHIAVVPLAVYDTL